MRLIILGSGASQPAPRPCCSCKTCLEARRRGIPYSRTGPSLFIEDAKAVVDTPEDIREQLIRENIKDVKAVFYTHWHPDHTSGFRIFEEMNWDYITWKAKKTTPAYLPKGTIERLRNSKMSGILDYAVIQKTVSINEVDENSVVRLGRISIRPIRIANDKWAYSIEEGEKKVLYAPCDIMNLSNLSLENYDMMILEFGWIKKRPKGKEDKVLNFYDTLDAIKKFKPKKVIFTHIEENRGSQRELKKLEKKYRNIKIAYDGMRIKV